MSLWRFYKKKRVWFWFNSLSETRAGGLGKNEPLACLLSKTNMFAMNVKFFRVFGAWGGGGIGSAYSFQVGLN